MRVIKMTPNVISRTLTLAERMIDDAKYRRGKGIGAGKHRYKFGKGSSYILKVINHSKPGKGMACRVCDEYIKPYEKCYSKAGNPDLTIRVYYHINCVEKLYQE